MERCVFRAEKLLLEKLRKEQVLNSLNIHNQ